MSHAPRRKGKHGQHEEGHGADERWLLTYADMVTLLMVLFIVLFAISQVDQAKFAALSQGLAKGFGAPVFPVAGGSGPLEQTGIAPNPLQLGAVSAGGGSQASAAEKRAVADAERARLARLREQARREAERLGKVRRRIQAALHAKGLEAAVGFRVDKRGLVVSIVTDRVLFPADRAQLQAAGTGVLDAVSPVLRALPNDLVVEGHTNTVPVKPKYYPSEWELSTARASSVLRYLVARHGVSARRVSAAGYADQRPLVPGGKPGAGTRNRRVEIAVLSGLAPEARALLPVVSPDPAR